MNNGSLELLLQDENGIFWVKTDSEKVFGIVDAFTILDCDGLKYEGKSLVDVLDRYCDIDQNWDLEANEIPCTAQNGESVKLVITADSVITKTGGH